MNYNKLTSDLDEIISSIRLNKENSVALFSTFLDEVKCIPNFSNKSIWDNKWRLKVWDFGKLFSNDCKTHASEYFNELKGKNFPQSEALSFIYSEIVFNFFGQNEKFTRDVLKDLIKNFPGNPEFYNTFGHYLFSKKEFEQAILNYKKAIDLDNKNDNYIESLFNAWNEYFSTLITNGKIENAEELRLAMLSFFSKDEYKSKFFIYRNIIVGAKDRVSDHNIINKKIAGINDLITKRIDGVRANLINIVSLITAIIGYLLIGTNLVLSTRSTKDSFLMMFGLGIIMIIFITTLNYQLDPNKEGGFWSFIKQRRFWAIFILLIILFLTYKYFL